MRYKYFICLFLLLSIVACSNEQNNIISRGWQESPTFTIPVTSGDGRHFEYVLRGEKGRIGFIDGTIVPGSKQLPRSYLISGKPNKYMWHFWGGPEELKGTVRIIGINEKGEQTKVLMKNGTYVWEYEGVGGSNNGAPAHMPSNMGFSAAGLWKLEVYIGDKLFGEVTVKVLEQ